MFIFGSSTRSCPLRFASRNSLIRQAVLAIIAEVKLAAGELPPRRVAPRCVPFRCSH
jgi:hypothetical protein